MLNDFVAEQGALSCGSAGRGIVPEVNKLIAATRRAGGAVIFVCDAHKPDDPEFERFAPHAVRGTWGARIIDALAAKPDDYVVKKCRLNSFYRTSLGRVLRELAPEVVCVAGVCTSICVMDAVSDLRTRGYEVVVPRKAVADFDSEAHDFALKRMGAVLGAKIV